MSYASAPTGRYTIANGTVLDTATGLVWQQTISTASYTWSDAQSYCASLSLDGSGWRVPSAKELLTLVDESIPPPGPAIDTTTFPNTPSTLFWSSSPLASNPSNAWYVDFTDASAQYDPVGYTNNVRCVR